ncbi:MAG: 23S rRNA (uracil(1939)-C(5))-methyltransferase RlmD, partial [Cytophagales bacterium]
LQDDISNQIREFVKLKAQQHEISFFDMNQKKGVLRNLILRNSNLGEWMVILQVFDFEEEKVNFLMDELKSNFSQISCLYLVVNQKGNETFSDLPLKLWHGKAFLSEKMGDLEFRIGPKTFYQTNSAQAFKLYSLAKEMADIQPGDVVYDLYTGAGTIANFVAKNAQKVVGVEYVEQAIEDAKVNSKINGIENTVFFAGDMKKVLNAEFVAQNGKPDIVITDPPRAGMDKEVVERILEMSPQKVVYVSCNPATQARDLQMLVSKYGLKRVVPVDMFPQTHHCESVALLELRGGKV